ncbi:hypothetical protein U0070_017871 [Myodes glareolus]|uniref:RBR-type E3 ubiquitin transferase n=1 Tax=Myodes glareolus TaxID=447135 RepID=A0AAW0K9B0_MYOGA
MWVDLQMLPGQKCSGHLDRVKDGASGGNIYIAQNQTLPAEEGKEWELLVGFSREGSHANMDWQNPAGLFSALAKEAKVKWAVFFWLVSNLLIYGHILNPAQSWKDRPDADHKTRALARQMVLYTEVHDVFSENQRVVGGAPLEGQTLLEKQTLPAPAATVERAEVVQLGQVEIKCPITECFEFLEETTVVYNLTHEDSIKYKYFLELGRIDSSTKPCPQCKHFTTFKKKGHIPTPSRSESRYKCHAPWHEGVNCKEYKKGDKLLRHWASEIEHGQRNAQKCPKCKIHIQRTEGCDHMTCSQCNTNFCYRCGERYRQLRFFGDHTSNLSIFGCKYRYLPERPHLRRLVRGSVCAGKLFIAPLILVLGLALGAIAVVIDPITLLPLK